MEQLLRQRIFVFSRDFARTNCFGLVEPSELCAAFEHANRLPVVLKNTNVEVGGDIEEFCAKVNCSQCAYHRTFKCPGTK